MQSEGDEEFKVAKHLRIQYNINCYMQNPVHTHKTENRKRRIEQKGNKYKHRCTLIDRTQVKQMLIIN